MKAISRPRASLQRRIDKLVLARIEALNAGLKDAAKLREELAEANARANVLSQRLDQANKALEQRRDDIAALKRTVDDLSGDLARARGYIDRVLEIENSRLRAEIPPQRLPGDVAQISGPRLESANRPGNHNGSSGYGVGRSERAWYER